MQQFGKETLSGLAAISKEYGVDMLMTFETSVNILKFKIFIEELRTKYFYDDICIYMDNLSVHICKTVKERLDELSIAYVFGPPYSPDFNPIESVFS